MKLTSVRIRNFRSFHDVTVPVNDYTCLVGPNGAGKSTVIAALNVFFRHATTASTNVTELQEEDFHQKNTSEPIEITLTFESLSDEAQTDFRDYFRQGKLIVFAKAIWDPVRKVAPVTQHGIRLGMSRFRRYFAMDESKASAKDLKDEYAKLRAEFTDLPPVSVKDQMAEALHAFESANSALCEAIPSHDEFYGWTKGANRLARFVQWVHVPAVKDAAEESSEAKETWLGLLLVRAVRSKVNFEEDIEGIKKQAREQYEAMLQKQQGALEDLSTSLSKRVAEWANPDSKLALQWEGDPLRAISVAAPFARVLADDAGFHGDLTRHGHGFQRSYLLALLQELAAGSDAGPTLFLACEEPELYQHPPQARHLASVFERLSRRGTQVMVCTHSPLFVSGRAFEDIRLLRRKTNATENSLSHTSFAAVSARLTAAGMPGPRNAPGARARLHQALQAAANEMFFSPVLVLVEGLEDVAYLTAQLSLSDRLDEFRRLGCHVVPTGGKEYMPQLFAVAKLLEIPTFIVFDGDADKAAGDQRQRHEQENAALLHLAGVSGQPALPTANVWLSGVVQWHTDIGKVFKTEVGEANLLNAQNAVRNQEGLVSEGGLNKNGLFIGLVLAELKAKGISSACLDKLCEAILAFARTARPVPQPMAMTPGPATSPRPSGPSTPGPSSLS